MRLILNVRYDRETTKLRCDIYFDVSKKDKSPEFQAAYNAIKNGDKLEVSTGYIVTEPIHNDGVHDGERYEYIQEYILPDHFALLPGDVGAYSWEDGGGVRANRKKKKNTPKIQADGEKPISVSPDMLKRILRYFPSLKKQLKTNAEQMSIQESLQFILDEQVENFGYVRDILYDVGNEKSFVVYEKYERDSDGNTIYTATPNLYRCDFSIENDGSITLGDEIKVKQKSEYVAANRKRKRRKGVKSNSEQTQIMVSELLLSKIKAAQPSAKEIKELYYDSADNSNYAVFAIKQKGGEECLYKIKYNLDESAGSVTIDSRATPVKQSRQYIENQRKRGNSMPFRKNKAKPTKARNKAQKPPKYLPMRANYDDYYDDKDYAEEYKDLYYELDEYDPPSIYDYVDAYDYLELDPAEIQEKVDYVVQDAESEEEAAQYLNETIEAVYEYAKYLEYIAEVCTAKVVELGYEPYGAVLDEPDVNMDTGDFVPKDDDDDEEEYVKKLASNRRKRTRTSKYSTNKKKKADFISGFAEIMKQNGMNNKDLKTNMQDLIGEFGKYRAETIKKIVANSSYSEAELEGFNNTQIAKLGQHLRIDIDTPVSYIMRGLQTNDSQNKNFTPQSTSLKESILAKNGGAK